jgi:hypothetical protein
MKIDERRVRKDLEGSGYGQIETLFGIYVEGRRKPTKTPVWRAGTSAEIRSEHLPYTTSLFGKIHVGYKHEKK